MRTTITSKGQIVIPAEIRHRLRISAGQQFEVSQRGQRITIVPIKSLSPSQAKGWLSTKNTAAELLAEARESDMRREKKMRK